MHTRDEYRERRPPESATLRRPGASAPVLPLAPRVQPTSQLSTNALAERLRGLTLMAGAYGVDLAAVRREHLAQVAQESTANQARYLAGVREALQRSNESSDED